MPASPVGRVRTIGALEPHDLRSIRMKDADLAGDDVFGVEVDGMGPHEDDVLDMRREDREHAEEYQSRLDRDGIRGVARYPRSLPSIR